MSVTIKKHPRLRSLLAPSIGAAVVVVALSIPATVLAGMTSGCYPAATCTTPSTPDGPTVSGSDGTAANGGASGANDGPTSASRPTTAANTSSLPFTGGDIEQLAGIGAGAVLLGGLLVLRNRRRGRGAGTNSAPGLVLAGRTVWSQWQSDSRTNLS